MTKSPCLAFFGFLLAVSHGAAAPQRIEWPTSTERGRHQTLDPLRGVIRLAGSPHLARVARVEIPPRERVGTVMLTDVREMTPSGVAPERAVEIDPPGGEPAGEISGYRYWILRDGFFRGHRIAHVLVQTTRTTDDGGTLALTGFTLDVTTVPDEIEPIRRRVTHPRTRVADARLLRAALDSDPLPRNEPEDLARAALPPEMDVTTLEYVVITSEAFVGAFQTLADLKTAAGSPADVTTVEWILANYDGIDLPARIRAYLTDAYRYRGLRYALLGGDLGSVPSRTTIGRYEAPQGVELTSDIYFACFDGDYNGNGNDALGEAPGLGEPGDSVDFHHEIAVARVPVSTPEEAATFIAKWRTYTGYDQVNFRTDYQNRVLSLGEVIFPSDWESGDDPLDIELDGADFCEAVLPYMPAFTATRMYQYHDNPAYPGAVPEVKNAVIAEINSGYGVIDHVGHGFRTTLSVGSGKLVNVDADAFTNTNAYGVMYAANCNSGAVAYDCIAEHLLLNPSGGIVASISSTDLDYPYSSDDFKYRWFESVFTGEPATLADAFYDANLPDISIAQLGENSIRWTIMALIALGDPSMSIWRDTPRTLTSDFSSSHAIGSPTLSVTVTDGGLPVVGATVCASKSDGYGVADTNGSGVAAVPFLPETTGPFTVTVTKSGYVPLATPGTVTSPGGAALRVDELIFHDGGAGGGTGNGDGRPDAGENVVVDLRLRNVGSQAATAITVVLRAGSPYVTVSDSTVSPSPVGPASNSTTSGAFAFTVPADMPDSLRHARIPATFEITSSEGSWDDAFPFSVYHRIVDIAAMSWTIPDDDGDGVLEPGETVAMAVTLQNLGEADAVGVAGVASVAGDFIMSNDTIVFGTIGRGESLTAGDLEVISTGGAAVELSVSLVISDSYGSELSTRSLDIVSPPSPTSIGVDPGAASIRLFWPPPNAPDLRGYRVSRADEVAGPFVEISNGVVEGGSFYVDEGLPPLTPFVYQVTTVDLSGNSSAPSAPVTASTSPPLLEGWPVQLPSGLAQGSPAIVDLDADGMNEVVFGWNYPFVIRGDGTEYIDGDESAITLGVFSTVGNGQTSFWNSPAIADLDGDGLRESVFCTFSTSGLGSMYVIDETGALDPGWPRPIGHTMWSTAAVGDIDGIPGMEIIVASGSGIGETRGALLGYHHEGTEIIDGDNDPTSYGVFHKGPSSAQYLYGSVALAPITPGAGTQNEIVYLEKTRYSEPTQGTLYVLRGDGTNAPGFPYGSGVLKGSTSSPAVADLDTDGDLEIVIVTENRIDVIRNDGTPMPGWPQALPAIPSGLTSIKDFMSSPAIGDVNLDGKLDIALGWLEGLVYVWTGETASLLPGFPHSASVTGAQNFDRYVRSPIIGNIDSDPFPEILVSTGDAQLLGINHDGSTAAGFPLRLDGTVYGSAALGDVNGDGDVNLVVQSSDAVIDVYDFVGVPFQPTEHPWPMFRHNTNRDGRFLAFPPVDVLAPTQVPRAATHAPRPNPFSSDRVVVPFDVPGGGEHVVIRVFDVSGREVRRLADGRFPEGRFRIRWDGRTESGRHLAPGVYFTRVEIGGETFLEKLTKLR